MDDSRRKIINELNKNIFVIAGAGSGKTTMLVNRMVAMVEDGIKIENICAITFTVNAAARFLVDFQKRLKERMIAPDDYEAQNSSDLGPSSDKKRAYCKKALENIDLCFAGTIDSFCQRVLAEIPYDAGIPSSTTLISEEDASLIYKSMFKDISNNPGKLLNEYNDFIKVHSNPAEAFSLCIDKVKEVTVLDLVYDIPTETLDERYDRFKNEYIKKLESDINKLLNSENISLENDSKAEYKSNFRLFKKRIKSEINNLKISNASKIISNIKGLISDLAFVEDPGLDYIAFGFKKGVRGYSDRYVIKDDEFLPLLTSDIGNIIYDYSMPFLVKSANMIRDKLKKEGLLTFNDYLLALRDALINDMRSGRHLIEHISEKYKYFLLDESQDTSPFQTEIFLYLTSECVATSKHECKPRPGSLFIVGDPKQSIYRFKNADIISYNDTQKMFSNDSNEVVELVNNFRSTNLLKDYFNHLFKNLEYYTPIPINHDKDVNNTGLYISQEGSYINVIKTMVNNPKYYLDFKDDKDDIKDLVVINGRRVRYLKYKDFMLITHSTSPHKKVMDELMNNNIPYFVEGKFNVNDNLLLKTIHAIYYYFVDRDRSDAIYNLLCSPLINLSGSDAISIKNNMNSSIKSIMDSIDNIYDDNPIIVFDRIIYDLNIFDRIGYKNMEYAYFLGEKIRNEIAHNNISTIFECERYIRKFMEGPLDRYINMDFESNGVYLANLHKVKGLERPVVILIKSGSKSGSAMSSCDYINNKSYLFEVSHRDGNFNNVTIITHKYDDKREEETVEIEKEKDRLRYVAVTRSRNYLIIEDGTGSNYWKSLINDDLTPFEYDVKENEVIECNDDLCVINSITFNTEVPFTDETPSKIKKSHKKYDEEIEVDVNKNKNATLVGTCIHRLMELIVKSNDKYSMESCINIISNEYDIDEGLKNTLINVFEVMHSGGFKQENGRDSNILDVILKAEEKYCEVPFTYKVDNVIHQGIIDLMYKINNKWYIVDYKTNLDGSGLDELYKGQLDSYKEALEETEGIKAEAYIYHINK